MIVLFTEQDLVSFGNYMISQERRDHYLNNEIIRNEVDKYLGQVNQFDLNNWIKITQEREKEIAEKAASSQKIKTVEDIPVVDDNSNEIQVTNE